MNCSQSCNECNNNGKCDPVDGECRCPAGYMGEQCELTCGKNQWGIDCMNECKCSSDRKICNPTTGACSCAAGLRGDKCDEYCQEGYWGPDCAFRCTCKVENSKCQATTGACVCAAGYVGLNCDQTCPEGFYGDQCANVCDCGENYCDPVIGCCNKNDLFCGSTSLEYREPERHSVATTASIVVSMLVVIAVALVALVFYYRRKYMKERDPVIPTITYHSGEKDGEANSTKNEFDNPLYRQTAALSEKTASKPKQPTTNKSDRLQNDYATLDDMYGATGPSTYDERLHIGTGGPDPSSPRKR